MKNKIIALALALSMTTAFVACGNETVSGEGSSEKVENTASKEEISSVVEEPEEKDPVELVFWYRNNVGEQEYTQEVEDKLNEMLKGLEGYEHITLRLHPCKDYKTDFALAQASGEQIDLVSTPALDATSEIANGSFIPLDEYLTAYPEVTADLPEWFVEMGNINGAQYYIPNYQQCANQQYLYMNKEWFDYSGYTEEAVQEILISTDFDAITKLMEDLYLAARECSGNDKIYIPTGALNNGWVWVVNATNMYNLGNEAFFYWDVENEEVAFTLTQENNVKSYVKAGEWYDKGYIYENSLTDTSMFKDGFLGEYGYAFDLLRSYGTTDMVETAQNTEKGIAKNGEVVVFDVDEYRFINSTNAAGGVAISSTCENPEDAYKVLALLFNSEYADFYNTLCWGLEGVHYNTISDGVIETTEFDGSQGGADTTYCYFKWQGGNTFNAWLNQAMTQEQEDYILNVINEGEDTIKSPLMGFSLNGKPVENEIAQLKAVTEEYLNTVRAGVKGADAQAYYDEFLEKMETAGLSKILEEFNRQVDEFRANK